MERVAALNSYNILDTAQESDFDELTELASAICQTPIALISLVDTNRQWFKARKGIPVAETPKEFSFCAHAIASTDPMLIVPDASKDARFSSNPLVTGDPHITFYAGVPLVDEQGFGLGSLCVIDNKVRNLSETQVQALKILAKQVIGRLALRRRVLDQNTLNNRLFESNQELIESEARFRSLVLQAPVGICIIRAKDLLIQDVNDLYLALIGKTRPAIENKSIWDAVPELAATYAPIVQEVIRSGIAFSEKEHELLLQRMQIREVVIVDFFYEPIRDVTGVVHSIMIIAIDVTEKVKATRKIQEVEERVRLAVKAAAIGTYDLEFDTGILISSDRFNEIFDMGSFGQWADYLAKIHPEDMAIRDAAHQLALKTGHLFYELRIIRSDNAVHWIRITGQYYFKENKVTRVLGTAIDITEFKRLQEIKDEFISVASHELKTPVTSLKASLQLLDSIKHDPFADIHIKLIEQASRSTNKMALLLDDLLNSSRLSDGKITLDKRFFFIADLFNSCCEQVALEGKHELIITADKSLQLFADEKRIEQVIVNFLNNVIKYAPASKEIELVAIRENNKVRISVTDKGPGIQEDKIPFLFDRYYKVQNEGQNYSGLGLGLYISSEIIKAHKGTIGVESELGKGSKFWFALPAD
ncbi:MAG: ATP-binding protein [Chitinophagaceae bacterium]